MVQTKASVLYLEIYAEKMYLSERNINVFCAIASSASIASWAIWSEISFLWGLIIAISQVLNSVKEFFPFAKKLKLLKQFAEGMKEVYISMEQDWFRVANGELTEKEINALLTKYKRKVVELESEYLDEDVLVEKSAYMEEADKKCNIYFERYFSQENKMDTNKENNNNNNNKKNKNSSLRKSFSLPITSSNPPMPPVRPPKKENEKK